MDRRIIPCLTWSKGNIVKTTGFSAPAYVGDIYNLVRIYSEKQVDELILLDIDATREGRGPNLDLVTDVAASCTAPLTYGGGIHSLAQISEIIYRGVEKVIIGAAAHSHPEFVQQAVNTFGSSTITVCIDYSYNILSMLRRRQKGRVVLSASAVIPYAQKMAEYGAGEIIIHCTDRDGTQRGYDTPLLGKVAEAVHVPVVGLGGAKDISDFIRLFRETKVSAAAAGSAMIYYGPYKAVLPSYSKNEDTSAPIPILHRDI